MHTKPVASSSGALTVHVDGVVNTELPAAILKSDRNRVVELIDQEPRLIEQLDWVHFGQALGCAFQSNHAKATDVYQRLLKAPQMLKLPQYRIDLQAMDFTFSPEVLKDIPASPEDLLARLNCFLATDHAKTVSSLQKQELYRKYLEANRDTTRLLELMTPGEKAQIDGMVQRDNSPPSSSWGWCNLV